MQRSCTAIVSSLRTEKYLESRSEKWSVPADIVLGVGHNLRLKLLMVSSVLTLRTTLWSRRCELIFGGRVAKLQIVNDTGTYSIQDISHSPLKAPQKPKSNLDDIIIISSEFSATIQPAIIAERSKLLHFS